MTNDKKLEEEISEITKQLGALTEEIKFLKKEILESSGEIDPYQKLAKYTREAMTQVKKDLAYALERGDEKEVSDAKEKEIRINKLVDEVAGLVEDIKKDDENSIEFDNPLYPTKRLRIIPTKIGRKKGHRLYPEVLQWSGPRFYPAILRWASHKRSARNWLGLLITGTGLVILSRGVWDASAELFSIQGSIIIGSIMISLMAWLERRKVFSVFASE